MHSIGLGLVVMVATNASAKEWSDVSGNYSIAGESCYSQSSAVFEHRMKRHSTQLGGSAHV
jgi:hypothetical protein